MNESGYFAIIPATVMYDERLKPIERLLYGTIVLLTRKDGFCSASNKYLADLYKCHEVSMTRYISNLQKCGYITVEIKDGYQRRIFVDMVSKGGNQNCLGGTTELLGGVSNSDEGGKQNCLHNNITHIDKLIKEKEIGEFSEETCRLAKMWEQKFGVVSSYKMHQIQDLIEDYSAENVEYAIKQAFQAGTSAWSYVRTVAMNEKRRKENVGNSCSQRTRKNDVAAGYKKTLELLGITGEEDDG